MKSCWINHGELGGHGEGRKESTTDYKDKHGWGKEKTIEGTENTEEMGKRINHKRLKKTQNNLIV